VAIVSKGGGAEQQNETAGSGEPIDFDPNDDTIVKVHYDVAAWTFDQQAELAEAMAEALVPHAWDGTELVVPEFAEAEVDALFERLEQELGPFPIVLERDDAATEFGLDEWSDADRKVLTEALIESEVPHRWEGTTVIVAQDAEDAVDDLLDAIESGELLTAGDSGADEPPDGALSAIFLAADKLAKDPLDGKARTTLIDLAEVIDAKHPPYAFAPRTWASTVSGVDRIVARFLADAHEGSVASPREDDAVVASDVIGLAQELRSLLRPYV
jgi:hypothetical protein